MNKYADLMNKYTYLDKHREEIFKKYSTKELIKDIDNYRNGKGKLSKVLNHFFEEVIFESKSNRYKYTPMEVLQDNKMMEWILDYIKSKPNFYTSNEVSNVKSFFRNGTRYARKVANFCPRNARDIYFRYFDNVDRATLNCLDTSCGFGSRMSAVLLSGANYYGFDPNKDLFNKLKECNQFYLDNDIIDKNQKCELYCCGSEVFMEELEGKFDVSFTSPPYFNLETYSNNDKMSYSDGDYDNWLNCFVKPTIENTYKYLKVGGYAMINIKNLTRGGKEPLFDDWFNIFSSIDGFEFVEIFEMKHQGKKNFTMNCNYTEEQYKGFKEPVMVFRKVR